MFGTYDLNIIYTLKSVTCMSLNEDFQIELDMVVLVDEESYINGLYQFMSKKCPDSFNITVSENFIQNEMCLHHTYQKYAEPRIDVGITLMNDVAIKYFIGYHVLYGYVD